MNSVQVSDQTSTDNGFAVLNPDVALDEDVSLDNDSDRFSPTQEEDSRKLTNLDMFLKKYSASASVPNAKKRKKDQSKANNRPKGAQPVAYSRFAAHKLPPIYVLDERLDAVKDALESNKQIRYAIKNGSKAFRIVPKSLDSREKIFDLLKSLKIGYFTFTEKTKRPRTFVLRGIPVQINTEVVLTLIKKLALSEVDVFNVERLTAPYSRQNGVPSNLLKLSAIINGNINMLTSVKEIDHFWVNISPFSSPRSVVQCFRCQRIGHSATNCNMDRRCVKCSRNHGKDDCIATPFNGRQHLKCALCSGNHCANAQICLVQQAEIAKIKNRQID